MMGSGVGGKLIRYPSPQRNLLKYMMRGDIVLAIVCVDNSFVWMVMCLFSTLLHDILGTHASPVSVHQRNAFSPTINAAVGRSSFFTLVGLSLAEDKHWLLSDYSTAV